MENKQIPIKQLYRDKETGTMVYVSVDEFQKAAAYKIETVEGYYLTHATEYYLNKKYEKYNLEPIQPMPTIEPQEDLINKPSHYHKNEIDVHGYLEKHFPKEPNVTVAEGFYMGNIIKYVSRHKEKNGIQDLEKAMANLKALIELESSNGGS